MSLSNYEKCQVRTSLGCTQETADKIGEVFDEYAQIDWSESTHAEIGKASKAVAKAAGIAIVKDPSFPSPLRLGYCR